MTFIQSAHNQALGEAVCSRDRTNQSNKRKGELLGWLHPRQIYMYTNVQQAPQLGGKATWVRRQQLQRILLQAMWHRVFSSQGLHRLPGASGLHQIATGLEPWWTY